MKYIASYSGGKDSTATVILAHEHGEPLDLIVFAEVMFDETTSGELPEHIDFIKNVAFPRFESWGYECRIVHSGETFIDWFFREVKKSRVPGNNGKRNGFPIPGHCVMNSKGKMKAIREFWKEVGDADVVQYVGIATDEPERLARLRGKTGRVSLLAKYGYAEEDARRICEAHGLLSPVYICWGLSRSGCWFCPNATLAQLRYIRRAHPELWARLLELENEPNLVRSTYGVGGGQSAHRFEERFAEEDRQVTIWDLPGMKGEKW